MSVRTPEGRAVVGAECEQSARCSAAACLPGKSSWRTGLACLHAARAWELLQFMTVVARSLTVCSDSLLPFAAQRQDCGGARPEDI